MFEFWAAVVFTSLLAIGCFVGGLYCILRKNKCGDDWAKGIVFFIATSILAWFILFVAPTGYAYRIEKQKVLTANPTCEILKKLDNGEWVLLNKGTNEVSKYKVKE